MSPVLEFSEVARETRRAWLHVAGTALTWVVIVGLVVLSDEEDLPLPELANLALGWASLFVASILANTVLERLRRQNSAEAADLVPTRPADASVPLVNAAWLPLPLAALASLPWISRWAAPRVQSSSLSVILCSRLGSRVIAKADISKIGVHAEGVVLSLASGEHLSLRTLRVPTSVFGLVFAPLARALLTARSSSLSFNEALAMRLAERRP